MFKYAVSVAISLPMSYFNYYTSLDRSGLFIGTVFQRSCLTSDISERKLRERTEYA